MLKPDGSYPGPEEIGRDVFTYSGARLNMEKKLFTEEFTAAIDGAKAACWGWAGAWTKRPREQGGRPDARPPGGGAEGHPLDARCHRRRRSLRATAAKFWLGWQVDVDAHTPGAQVNSQYVFDTPAKQNMYTALLAKYSALYGDDGVKLAAADSGPLDEGYVGGGS